ncbi:large ribosomal subunit protein mL52-like [Crassostrea virginica]|uniref:Large ribosomal subunit protein mL52 n=1 Tax=Crassostrea virginica TaxID=6565 RepID=A0A8B8ELB8_CRAVI|nr:39S ribosomal protein L52, mitochondrial-like [Crassostrea virginica]
MSMIMSTGCIGRAISIRTKLALATCSNRSISTTPVVIYKHQSRFKKYKSDVSKGFGAKWRLENGKAIDNTAYGPLIDLPDFSYLDGRPAPLTKRQVERMEEKKQISKRVYKLLGEINYAKERHRRLTEEKQAEKPFPLKPKS